jgi:hypothetical protein
MNVFGLPASAFASVAAVGLASGGDAVSSGSIIALEVPGPGGLALLGVALGLLPRRRRAQ